MVEKGKYLAHKESGGAACVFALSIIPEVIKMHNARSFFTMPFYGLTFDNKKNYFYEWTDDYDKATDKVEKFVMMPAGLNYFKKIDKQGQKDVVLFKKQVEKLLVKISKLADYELVREFNKFCSDYFYYFSLGVITFLCEGVISERLTKSLAKKHPAAINELSYLLNSGYQSFMILSEAKLLAIKKSSGARRNRLVNDYQRDFFFIGTNYEHAQVLDQAKVLEMADEAERGKSMVGRQKRIKINLTKYEKNIVNLLKLTEPIRDRRKYINLLGSYTLFRFLDELTRRTKVSHRLAERMFWFEYPEAFRDKSALVGKLKNRNAGSMACLRLEYIYSESVIIKEKEERKRKTVFSGVPASVGKVTGVAKIIKGPKDFHKLSQGEILIAPATRPEFLPVMRKAAAIVTDEGSIVSHAAIVSREFGIPCVVGTKIASSWVKDGDTIEVEANKGLIRIIKGRK